MIRINKTSGVPKYQQIVSSIEQAILSGDLKRGDQLPSINTIKQEHNLSRDTVLMAFNELKIRGIIQSIVGKGYYITSENITIRKKIFLLFDELNSFKEDLFRAFRSNLDENIQVDIYFHNFNFNVFTSIIENNVGNYNQYVVMPANLKNTFQVLKKLPENKVYILDQMPEDLKSYPGIYQNFENGIYSSLNKLLSQISNYKKLILIYSKNKEPKGILEGFIAFCEDNKMPYEILDSLAKKTPKNGDIYIIPDDENLLRIIKKMKIENLELSKDVGIISYNDTLLKEIVEGGITTISTNFTQMGKSLAEMILNEKSTQIENPYDVILRNSL